MFSEHIGQSYPGEKILRFKSGDIVKITKNNSGHGLNIDSIYKIEIIEGEYYGVTRKNITWLFTDEECEAVDTNVNFVQAMNLDGTPLNDCGDYTITTTLDYSDITEDEHQAIDTERMITEECRMLENTLISKNRKYGNTATREGYPFALDPVVAIKARLNDKIGRLAMDHNDEDEDILQDILGYIILLRIAKRNKV
jgi:hypothetical protein